MAGSRRSAPADGGDEVVAAVDASLAAYLAPGGTVAIALSGGRDSVALLDACVALRATRSLPIVAIHVHHGLSPQADEWAAFCEATCRRAGAPLQVMRVRVGERPSGGVEAAARARRYEALAVAARAANAAAVVLAHHQDDQAETLLLQLVRGAGPHGMAAMPVAADARGVRWLRPLLGVRRRAIEAYVAARALPYVDDPSNDDDRHRRNAVRLRVAPALAATFPGYPATLARAATLQTDAARLADDLAALDAEGAVDGERLDRRRLAALPEHRARNLLRWFLRSRGLRAPGAAQLAEMLRQLATSPRDARVELVHDGRVIGLHRDGVVVHAPPAARFEVPWRGEPEVALPHGRVVFEPRSGEGLAVARVTEASVVLRPRAGGERLRLVAAGPSRTVKNLLQEAAIPAWARGALPLVFCDGTLAAIPGIGVDAAWRALPGEPGVLPVWHEANGAGSPAPA